MPTKSKCDCGIIEHCAVCDPEYFKAGRLFKLKPLSENMKMLRLAHNHRNEQEEAAVFDTLLSAIEERLVGMEFTTEQKVKGGKLHIKIKRFGKKHPCKIQINLEI